MVYCEFVDCIHRSLLSYGLYLSLTYDALYVLKMCVCVCERDVLFYDLEICEICVCMYICV